MKVKVLNKNRRPIDLYNAAGAAVTVPPGVVVPVDASFTINLPKNVIIVK